jgi:hypothetical protein
LILNVYKYRTFELHVLDFRIHAKLKSIIECHRKSYKNDTGLRKPHHDEPNDLKRVGLCITKRKIKQVVTSDQPFLSLKRNYRSSRSCLRK